MVASGVFPVKHLEEVRLARLQKHRRGLLPWIFRPLQRRGPALHKGPQLLVFRPGIGGEPEFALVITGQPENVLPAFRREDVAPDPLTELIFIGVGGGNLQAGEKALLLRRGAARKVLYQFQPTAGKIRPSGEQHLTGGDGLLKLQEQIGLAPGADDRLTRRKPFLQIGGGHHLILHARNGRKALLQELSVRHAQGHQTRVAIWIMGVGSRQGLLQIGEAIAIVIPVWIGERTVHLLPDITRPASTLIQKRRQQSTAEQSCHPQSCRFLKSAKISHRRLLCGEAISRAIIDTSILSNINAKASAGRIRELVQLG